MMVPTCAWQLRFKLMQARYAMGGIEMALSSCTQTYPYFPFTCHRSRLPTSCGRWHSFEFLREAKAIEKESECGGGWVCGDWG